MRNINRSYSPSATAAARAADGYIEQRQIETEGAGTRSDHSTRGSPHGRETHTAYPANKLMEKISVVLADDSVLVRRGVQALLAKEADVELVAVARDGEQAVDLAQELHPDVIIMDIYMPRLDGIRAMKEIRRHNQDTAIVILSSHVDATLVRQTLNHGAAAYVVKRRVVAELVPAIHAAVEGTTFLSAAIPPHYRPGPRG